MEVPMKTVLLVAGAAALALSAGQALATAHHKHAGATIAGPKQPIPYAQLDAYLKAKPAQRAKKDWWAGQAGLASNSAATTAANASATAPAKGAAPAASGAVTPASLAPTTSPEAAPPPTDQPAATPK